MTDMERRLVLVEEVLGLSDTKTCDLSSCSECLFKDTNCPLSENRLTKLGSLVVNLLDELQQNRVFMREILASGLLTPEIIRKANQAIEIDRLERLIAENEKMFVEAKESVQLQRKITERIIHLKQQLLRLQVNA